MMPVFLAALIGGLASAAGTIAGKVLLSLGIGFVAYSGIDTSIVWAKAQFLSGLTGLPAQAVGMAAALKIGVCISMLTSALVARLTLAGMTSGTVRRWALK